MWSVLDKTLCDKELVVLMVELDLCEEEPFLDVALVLEDEPARELMGCADALGCADAAGLAGDAPWPLATDVADEAVSSGFTVLTEVMTVTISVVEVYVW